MSFDVEQHVLYNISNAVVQTYPFPHFFVRPVFPEDYYRELLERLPGNEAFVPLDQTGAVPKGAYRERHVCSLEDLVARDAGGDAGTFWKNLSSWLMSDEFADMLVRKFQSGIDERYGRDVFLRIVNDCRFVRDHTHYSITPHTDKPEKLMSLLFYLPRDESKRHLGTSIYAPKDPDFRCPGTAHYEFDAFKHVARMEYVPNALFAFIKTDQAFHGVEPIADTDVERDLMLYNIYIKKILKKKTGRVGFRWPWQSR